MNRGHVFIVRGDLTKIRCDAVFVPSDSKFHVTKAFGSLVGKRRGGRLGLDPWEPGERVRDITADGSDRRVFIGRIAVEDDADLHPEWFSDAARDFVERASKATRRKAGRRPLLALNLIGTGEGGARAHKGTVLNGLLETLIETAERVNADVVVVCWRPLDFAAAQRARLSAIGTTARKQNAYWDFHPRTSRRLHSLARSLAADARAGSLALFLGAGASADAGLPTWDGLLGAVNQQLGRRRLSVAERKGLDHRDVAALLERRLDAMGQRSTLTAEVAKQLEQDEYSLQHALLGSLPVGEFVTTNFDRLFEQAATSADRRLSVIPFEPDVDADRWLLKLHGCISEPASLVFTRATYFEAPRQRGALFGLVQAMLLTRTMLFLGYSLTDEDFHEVIHEVRQALPAERRSKKLGTAITLFDDRIKRELWQEDVDVVPIRPALGRKATPPELADAGRDVARFVDLVGALSTDLTAFVLDPAYEDMLDDDEFALRDALAPLQDAGAGHHGSPGWQALTDLLRRLGAAPSDQHVDRT